MGVGGGGRGIKISASAQAVVVHFGPICHLDLLLIMVFKKRQSPNVPSSSAHALSQMKGSSLETFTLLMCV